LSNIEDNKKVVRKFIGLLGSDDISGLLRLMADDLQWIVPQDPTLTALAGSRNKAQWTELYRAFKASVKADVKYTIIGMTAEGARVAAEVECRADTPIGPFHNRYHFLFEVRDGLIVVAKEYADSLYMYMFAKRAGSSG
jgi:uncharacterized protein